MCEAGLLGGRSKSVEGALARSTCGETQAVSKGTVSLRE